jgi:hypothetical protein
LGGSYWLTCGCPFICSFNVEDYGAALGCFS